jgi:UDP-N-acetylmuramoylalanine--D-glutamate ligase
VDFKNLKVLVLGAGASGLSAAKFLRERGAVVGIYDDAKGQAVKEAIYVSDVDFEGFDYCVISPGVSIHHPVAKKFEGRIISEIALGFRVPHKRVIAITGTNGKTTVTNMIGRALGKRGVVCGNVGVPVTSVTKEIAKKIAVTEVSSFMLETDNDFRPNIGVILNISQDHLERHGTMEEYIRCKGKLTNAKVVIINHDCPNARVLGDERALYFSTKEAVRGVYLVGKDVIFNLKGRPNVIFNLDEFRDERPHQISNILAVVLACKLLGVSRRKILVACKGGQVSEHRVQPVGEVGNVAFINDSKATNIASCLASCACFKSPINLLVGGVSKGQDFGELFAKLPTHVDHVFAFGESANEIVKAATGEGFKRITKCTTMADATRTAFEHGFGPRVVLLAPACSSFDEFSGFAERGRVFAKVVREIADAEG